MREKVMLKLFPNRSMAEMFTNMLQEAGVPVSLRTSLTGIPAYHAGGPAEIWLEDAALLNDPEVKQTIDDIFAIGEPM